GRSPAASSSSPQGSARSPSSSPLVGRAQEGLAKRRLCRRAALEPVLAASSVALVLPFSTPAPCVLAAQAPSHPRDERRSAKPSYRDVHRSSSSSSRSRDIVTSQ